MQPCFIRFFSLSFVLAWGLPSSCAKRDVEPHFELSSRDKLVEKKNLYCDLSAATIKARGWAVDRCDGLLFSSLRGIGCGSFDQSAFEDNGQFFRDPTHSCFVAGAEGNESDSSISKDMMLGLASWLLWSSQKAPVDRIIAYGEAHSWVMGDARDDTVRASKCLMAPAFISDLYDLRKYLDGQQLAAPHDGAEGKLVTNTGFRAHLDVLHALFAGSLHSAIFAAELATLKDQAERQPHNALYQAAFHLYTDGDQGAAEALLLDEGHFPKDHLPGAANHCSNYLWQDDEDPADWAPCQGEGQWDGTDLIIAAAVATGGYNKKAP